MHHHLSLLAVIVTAPQSALHTQVWAAVMAAPMVDEALAELLKAEQKAAKTRSRPPAAEEDGRKKKRRRDVDEDADEALQVALLWHLLLSFSTAMLR